MVRFLLYRLLTAIPTLTVVSLMVFILMRNIPGDPAAMMLGDMAQPGQIEAMRAAMGLDRPLPLQYLYWIGGVLQGDLGRSIATGQAVLPLMLDRFAVSATIVLVAVFLATLIAVPAGMLAAWRQDRPTDLGIVAAATLSMSVPGFWLGLMFIMFFGLWLGWLPVVGYVSFERDFWAAFLYSLMPVGTMVLIEFGAITRMARASTIDVARLDYITHARAKGLSERRVITVHVLKNIMIPVVTVLGLELGSMIAFAVVTETVFSWPGMGKLLIDSINLLDRPVIVGYVMLTVFIFVFINLTVDLVYSALDPRVRAGMRG